MRELLDSIAYFGGFVSGVCYILAIIAVLIVYVRND